MKTSLAGSWNSCCTEVVICCLSYKSKSSGVFCHVSVPLADVQLGFSCSLELHSNEPSRAVEAPRAPQVLSQSDIFEQIKSASVPWASPSLWSPKLHVCFAVLYCGRAFKGYEHLGSVKVVFILSTNTMYVHLHELLYKWQVTHFAKQQSI